MWYWYYSDNNKQQKSWTEKFFQSIFCFSVCYLPAVSQHSQNNLSVKKYSHLLQHNFNTPQHLLMVKNNELCYQEFYVNVEVMNAARDSLTSIGISTPSQLHNSMNPTCLLGLNPIKLL